MTSFISKNEASTQNFGEKISKGFHPGDILCLYGDLGAGKTTLVKGIARGLGLDPKSIKSPTFQLCRLYQTQNFPLYHCDFYRNETITEHLNEELQDVFSNRKAVFILEWPEKIGGILPKKHIALKIEYSDRFENERIITMKSYE